jgi:hypothetical protein
MKFKINFSLVWRRSHLKVLRLSIIYEESRKQKKTQLVILFKNLDQTEKLLNAFFRQESGDQKLKLQVLNKVLDRFIARPIFK